MTSQIQPTGTTTPISIAELNNAELEILKYVQSGCFKEELGCLKQADNQATSSRQNVLKKSSNILIRVGGRLQRVPINTDARHPVILPRKHHMVKLLIQYYHHLAGHSGLEYTLSLARQRYWIINRKSVV